MAIDSIYYTILVTYFDERSNKIHCSCSEEASAWLTNYETMANVKYVALINGISGRLEYAKQYNKPTLQEQLEDWVERYPEEGPHPLSDLPF